MNPQQKTDITKYLDAAHREQCGAHDPIVVDTDQYMSVLDYFQDAGYDTGPNGKGNVPKLSWRGHRIDMEPA